MMSRAHIIGWLLSFLGSSSHSIENRIGQHTSLIDQSTFNTIINHVLKFTRIGVKSDLPRHRQCFLLDHHTTPVYTKGSQTLLLVVFHGFRNSLLLLVLEIGFRHGDDVLLIELGSRHVDLDTDFRVPLGVPKDVLMQKLDLQTQKANTRSKR